MIKLKSFICIILFTSLIIGLLPNNLFALVDEDYSAEYSQNTWKKIYSSGGICIGLLSDDSLWEWCTFPDDSTVLKQSKFATPIKMLENVSEVAIGPGYVLALTMDNNLWSWGTNKNGELGNGNNTDALYPQNIMNDVIKIHTGKDSASCFAIKSDGSLWGWGNNFYGQLGDGTNVSKNTPTHIEIPSLLTYKVSNSAKARVYSVVSGTSHTFAIMEDNSLWSWGDNSDGQLGNWTYGNSYKPVWIMDDVDKVAIDSTSCFALKKDSTLLAWGNIYYLQLEGDQNLYERNTPREILKDVSDVIPAPQSAYAIMTDKSLYELGSYVPMLSVSRTQESFPPVKIMDNITKVSAYNHVMALDENGSLWVWGDNSSLQLGTESADPIITPTLLREYVTDIATDYDLSSFITYDGSLFQLGNINGNKISVPKKINVPSYIKSINVSDNYMTVQFSGSSQKYCSDSDFTISSTTTDESGQTVTDVVYFSVNSFDPESNTAVLQLQELPYYSDSSIIYAVSYKGHVEVKAVTTVIPKPTPNSSPEPTPSYTPEPTSSYTPEPTSYSTPEPTSYSTPEPTTYSTPEPTTYSTPEPTTFSTPEPTPSYTPEPTSYSTPEPTSYSTPEPTSYSTPEPTSYSIPEPTSYSTPEHTTSNTPQPTSHSTPKPARTKNSKKPETTTIISPIETIPGPVPQETPAVEDMEYTKVVQDFKQDVIEITNKFKDIDDPYYEKNENIANAIEKAIEKAAIKKIICESGSIEITQELIIPQIELALKASKETEAFIQSENYEPNRICRKIINIYADLSKPQLNIVLPKDITALIEDKIDLKISSSFGSIILYYEDIDKLLSNELTINMTNEEETENAKIKSIVNIEFKYANGTIKETLDYRIGLELPYGDGNPNYCTIYNEPPYYSNNSARAKDEKSKALYAINTNMGKMQLQRFEFSNPFVNVQSNYSSAYGALNKKAFNMGGSEDKDRKTLSVRTAKSGKYYVIEEKITFNDIKNEDTAIKEAIEVLASKGIINGRGDGSFHPEDQLNRSEFACLLVRSLNIIDDDVSADFEDVKETSWYYNQVAIAYKEGLISGYGDKTFKGNKKINRQEIITICSNTLSTKKGYLFPSGDKWLNFTDKDLIPVWARKFVSLGNREGLVVKKSDGKFNGTGICTRKDAAIILYKLYKKL